MRPGLQRPASVHAGGPCDGRVGVAGPGPWTEALGQQRPQRPGPPLLPQGPRELQVTDASLRELLIHVLEK